MLCPEVAQPFRLLLLGSPSGRPLPGSDDLYRSGVIRNPGEGCHLILAGNRESAERETTSGSDQPDSVLECKLRVGREIFIQLVQQLSLLSCVEKRGLKRVLD